MEKWKKRSIELSTSIAFGVREKSPSVIPYYPQKTRISSEETRFFARSVPEKYGISSRRIYSLLCELEAEGRSNIHSLMILAGGEVIAECSREGYDVNVAHLSHSMSKTVTGMAIGLLVDDGILDLNMRLVDILPEYSYKDKRFSAVTLHQVLSMTSGAVFSEAGSVTETEWCESFFSSGLKFTPGSKFHYNSMNSYILAKIVSVVSGKSFIDFLDERLFSPLQIKNYFWERGPEGVEKGGWGLYMSAESWAKLGYMMLSGGEFFGKRILSENWVKKSTATHALAPSVDGDFNYGYQLWVGRSSDEVLFNGMLGQNVWVCPRNNIVAVVFSGNNELFQNSPTLELIRHYLGCEIEDSLARKDIKVLHERETQFFDSRRWVRPLEKKKGLLTWLGVRSKTPFDERFSDILGSYAFADNQEGMLPLFVRAMQNNLDSRLERIGFEQRGDSLYMSFRESGVDYLVELGLYDYKSCVLDFRGEKYIVKAMAEAMLDVEGMPEYRIELVFPELPNTRMLTVRRTEAGAIKLSLFELPNNKIADTIIDNAVEASGVIGFAVDLLERRFGTGFIQKKIERTFAQELVGADLGVEGYEKILEEENLRLRIESGSVKLLRSLVDRFFKDDELQEQSAPKAEEKKPQGFLGRLLFGRTKSSQSKKGNTPEENQNPQNRGSESESAKKP